MFGIVLAGPTGVGKTNISLKLASLYDADIISADSMQVYKYMDIGTAKIKTEEMQGIKHYMLDIAEPDYNFSVGEYQKKTDNILNELEKKERNVIIVGGTGLYIDSVTRGLAELPPENIEIREKFSKMTAEEIYNELKKVDEASAEKINRNNKKRLERALEVYFITGERFSVLSQKNKKNNNYNFFKYAVERDRNNLYERINNRVDEMFRRGLIEEARGIFEKYAYSLEKIQAIGYKELFSYFKREITLEEAKEIIKRDSRRYAKRQFTWFKNDDTYKWFNLDKITEEEILEKIKKEVK